MSREVIGRAHIMMVLCAWCAMSTACIGVDSNEGAANCDEGGELCSGGETTVFEANSDAFGFPAHNLDEDDRAQFERGRTVFHSRFLAAEEFAFPFGGLGPRFNDDSCGSCHAADGRGRPYNNVDQPTPALLIRISRINEQGIAEPVEFYGSQLQPLAIEGVEPEMDVSVEWSFETGQFNDLESFELATPTFRFTNPAHGRLPQGFVYSPRATPAMIGLGLLEAIPAADILAKADPEDDDLDGISGRPNIERDAETGERRVGRFGWKAGHATLHSQNAAALLGDMGIVTKTVGTADCDAGVPSSTCEQVDGQLQAVSELDTFDQNDLDFYTRHLAVPARRDIFFQDFDDRFDESIDRGEELFAEAQCAACHTPSWTTASELPDKSLAGQQIAPYTDLLLHDMGEGLADGRPDGVADGREWRTAPLWGIGLVSVVNNHTRFLHDGRARNLSEAILWHGGEAAESRDRFKAMSARDRRALLDFLRSL